MRGGGSSSSSTAAAAAGSSSNAAAAAAANGHAAVSNAGGDGLDDDDDVIMGNTVVSLKDPYTNMRMATAARFVDTAGAAPSAFDLEPFLDMAQRTRKWMDPHSSKPSSVQSLQVRDCAWLLCVLHICRCQATAAAYCCVREFSQLPGCLLAAGGSMLGMSVAQLACA
jgi:hypothetical protein